MIRRDQRRDANEREIIDGLTAIGCSVDQMDGGKGRMDLLVGEPKFHNNILMEVKMPGKDLNPLQRLYHKNWKGKIHVVHTIEKALEVVSEYQQRGGFNGKKKVRTP